MSFEPKPPSGEWFRKLLTLKEDTPEWDKWWNEFWGYFPQMPWDVEQIHFNLMLFDEHVSRIMGKVDAIQLVPPINVRAYQQIKSVIGTSLDYMLTHAQGKIVALGRKEPKMSADIIRLVYEAIDLYDDKDLTGNERWRRLFDKLEDIRVRTRMASSKIVLMLMK